MTFALLFGAGWLGQEFFLFLTGAGLREVLALVPGALAVLVLCGTGGLLLSGRPRLTLFLGALLVVASFALPELGPARFPRPRLLARELFVFLGVAILTCRVQASRWTSGVGVAFCLGAVASASIALVRMRYRGVEMSALWVLVGCLLCLPGLRSRLWSRARGLAVCLGLGGFLWQHWDMEVPLELEPPDTGLAPSGPSLVLIVLDTVGASHLAPYGYERVTTPRLDAFVDAHAVVYPQARSASSWTLPSHATLFTGELPSQHGAYHQYMDPAELASGDYALPPEALTLAERLQERGYRTGAVVANNAFLHRDLGLDQGFGSYDDRPGRMVGPYAALSQLLGFRLDLGRVPYRRAESITRTSIAWLEEASSAGETPYFFFVNYMDAHGPYLPPPPFHRLFSEAQPLDLLRPEPEDRALQYDRELSYLDAHLGGLLDWLKDSPAFEDTLVVITSDHGEGFGEHGWWGHNMALYDEEIRVPLYWKPVGEGVVLPATTPVSGVALHEALLRALDLEVSGAAYPGIDAELFVFPYQREEKARSRAELGRAPLDFNSLSSRTVVWLEEYRKTLVYIDGRVEVFDVGIDAGETAALPLSEQELSEAKRRAESWWGAHPAKEAPNASGERSVERDLEGLRTLGYVP